MGLRPGEMRIINALSQAGHMKGLTFTELKNKTRLSSPSLSDYLKMLQEKMIIAKNVKTRKYRISEAYLPMDFTTDAQKYMQFLIPGALNVAERIRQIEDEEERESKYRKFLEFYYSATNFLLWTFIHEVAKQAREREALDGELPEAFALAQIKEFIFDFLSPLVNILHMVDFNLWSAHHVLDQILGERAGKMDKVFDEFFLIIEELMKISSK